MGVFKGIAEGKEAEGEKGRLREEVHGACGKQDIIRNDLKS